MKKYLFAVVATTLLFSQSTSLSYAGTLSDSCLESLYNSTTVSADCLSSLSATTESAKSVVQSSSTTDMVNNLLGATAKTTTEPTDIELESAPLLPAPIPTNNTMNSWELIHRTPMLAGFVWTGTIAQYITPAMYEGTSLAVMNPDSYLGGTNPFAKYLIGKSTSYESCLRNESFISYGLGERIEPTDIKELKVIAKICAQEFHGKYFDGKEYTTREEYLMMLFTMFEEGVEMEGKFQKSGKFASNDASTYTRFGNVSGKSWYAPYLAKADEIGLIDPDERKWQVAQEISDTEAVDMLALYAAYRMDFTGDTMERGLITTETLKYHFSFHDLENITIRVQ